MTQVFFGGCPSTAFLTDSTGPPNMPTLRLSTLPLRAKPPGALGSAARAGLMLACLAGGATAALAADATPPSKPAVVAPNASPAVASDAAPAKKSLITGLPTKAMAEQVREAVDTSNSSQKRLTLTVNGKAVSVAPGGPQTVTPPRTPTATPAPRTTPSAAPLPPARVARPAPPYNPPAYNSAAFSPSRAYPLRSNPAARPTTGSPASDAQTEPTILNKPWAYQGDGGPQAWGQLKPDYKLCATGQRQSPINIDEPSTLQGPAAPLQFNYQPSTGSVVHSGHTLAVDVEGDNAVTVRDSTFRLVQIQFHTPSEIRINDRSAAMVAHLMHKNDKGQLAVVAVMLDPGAANTVINTVWTYMPLDIGDRVRLPAGALDLNELLPKDQRYFQFIGSLTTPPCTEGVLWLVLKQTTPISPEQLKLFTQLFPHNARPVQALNGRPVRNAQ